MHSSIKVAPFTTATPTTGPFAGKSTIVRYHGIHVNAGAAGFVEVLDAAGNHIGGAAATTTAPGIEDVHGGLEVLGPLTLVNAIPVSGTVRWS